MNYGPRTLELLNTLKTHGPQKMSDVRKKYQLEYSEMRYWIRGLEKRGLVKRQFDNYKRGFPLNVDILPKGGEIVDSYESS